jgi:hypothetical protein
VPRRRGVESHVGWNLLLGERVVDGRRTRTGVEEGHAPVVEEDAPPLRWLRKAPETQ